MDESLVPRSARSARQRSTLWTLLVHLRLPFQLLLSPVYLWGWLLAGGGVSGSVLLGFVAFHVFLYGGVTAFNSYYDRDEGPVGGLERPPPVVRELLPFSLGVKAAGWLLAAAVNWPFFWLYGGFAILSFAYSHPRTRLKADPLASVAVVAVGQGVLAFLGGWSAVRGEIGSAWSPDGVVGALAATLLILSLYPLTQVYQIEEDRARGDRTIAVAWGPRGSFAFSLVCQALGGAMMIAVLYQRYGLADALLAATALALQFAVVARWAARFDRHQVLGNYRRVMRLNMVTTAGLVAYLGYHLVVG
jgi:1,4-dihydroxy-2-naphthoate octaprenyltransferase